MNNAIRGMREQLEIILHGAPQDRQESEWKRGRAMLRGLIGSGKLVHMRKGGPK